MSLKSEFQKELESLINSKSMENGSNTPDFILAEYLTDCLEAFNKATVNRTVWYSAEKTPSEDLTGSN